VTVCLSVCPSMSVNAITPEPLKMKFSGHQLRLKREAIVRCAYGEKKTSTMFSRPNSYFTRTSVGLYMLTDFNKNVAYR